MIKAKDVTVLESILRKEYDPLLILIIVEIIAEFEDIVFTCGYRSGDRGVHGTDPCRGIDIREWIYDHPEDVVDFVNRRWQYDPHRPSMVCAMLHDTGKGMHLHIQTHPNTIRKE